MTAAPPRTLLPAWFVAGTGSITAAVAVGGLVGLWQALDAGFDARAGAMAGAVAGSVALPLLALWAPRRAARGAHLAAAVATAVAAVLVVVLATAPGEHVLGNRDPGSYQSTAKGLTTSGDLTDSVRTGGLEAVPLDHLDVNFGAVYLVEGGRLEFQFNHMTSVLLAVADGLGGTGWLHRLPALAVGLGLLGLYGVTVLVVRRPWLALVAVVAVGTSLPWWFAARDTYSEPFVVALYWPALMLGLLVLRRPGPPAAAVAGLALGAALGVRADTALLVAPLLALSGAAVARRSGRRRADLLRCASVALVALVLGGLLAWVDLTRFTGRYYDDLAGQIRLMYGLCLVALLAGPFLAAARAVLGDDRGRRVWAAVRAAGRAAAWPAAAGAAAGLLWLWFVRPRGPDVLAAAPNGIVEGIQRRDGLAVEPRLAYSEHSMEWMSWYLGPAALATAVAGAALAVRRTVAGVADAATTVLTVTGLGTAALYLWRPEITPDHPWVLRRFVPMVVPALVVWAVVALAAAWPAASGGHLRPWWRALGASVLTAAVLVGPATTTWPVRRTAPERSYAAVVEGVCRTVGPRATVVVYGNFETLTVQQAVRSWCGVPAASPGPEFDVDDLAALAAAATGQGRELFVVSSEAEAARFLGGVPAEPVATFEAAGDVRTPEPTLDRPPDRFAPADPDLPPPAGPDAPPRRFVLHVAPLAPRA